ncbi:MAG: hypothetical protein K0R57_5578 [Paenibacillaceae bacterium]|jgi:3D (Asp-Asp-Asp) domain-containing protein|nr:hypothetical protein [Paenibacillaceae bacterium]
MIHRIRLLLTLTLLLGLLSPLGHASAYHAVANEEASRSAANDTEQYYRYRGITTIKVPQSADVPYVVNAGDTLYEIANSFDTTIAAIQAYNHISNPNLLHIGQELKIPVVQEEVSLPLTLPLLEGKEPIIEKVLTSTLTAYTAGVESTGKTPSHPQYGITYSGVRAEEGRTVAVDPKVIPLGSIVYIEGVGIRKAEDTGSAIKGSKIDVYMEDVSEARTFGRKHNVKVFVLATA